MAQPVWVLSVDLRTKTAVFQSGLADAARSAKGSFNDIKQDAGGMGRDVSYSMGEARHGVMLLGEEFGVHLPRALTSFISSIGPIGAAMEAAFPFLAVAVGATLLIEHLVKMREEAEKAANANTQFGTTVATSLTALDDKLLSVGIQLDELSGNHLGALHKELEKIDHASMADLRAELDILAKAADASFAQIKTSWYQIDAGSAGAKHALEEFKVQYDSLTAQGKNKDASDLLAGTLESAKKTLEVQKQSATMMGMGGVNGKQIEAQGKLIDMLNAQVTAEQKIAALKQAQTQVAEAHTDNKIGADDDKKWRALAQEAKQEADDAQKAWEEAYKAAVSKLQESEKLKIDATKQGSAARLAAIDAAINEEDAKGLQATGFYKSLLTDRVNLTRQMGEEQTSLTQQLANENLQLALSSATQVEKAAQEQARYKLALHQITSAQEEAQEIAAQKALLNAEMAALDQRIAALVQGDDKYMAKKQEFENKKKELEQKSADAIVQIQQTAEEKKLSVITDAENRMGQMFASTAAQSIIQGKNMGAAFAQMGSQMLQAALTNMLQIETVQGRKRLGDARTAAADAFQWAGNPVLGAPLAAAAFSMVMAFDKGGIVPGTGGVDTVNAKLTPGEAVLPKKLTEGLTNAARSGDLGGKGPDVHVHHHATYNVQAFDSDGVSQVLQDHGQQFADHAANHIRKMNQ